MSSSGAVDAAFVPVPNRAVTSVQLEGDTVLLEQTTGTLHVLDRIGTAVWSSLDGKRTVGEIAAQLSQEASADRDEVGRDVTRFVRELLVAGLVSDATSLASSRAWVDGIAAEIVGALRGRDVRPLLLGGPSITRWLYADDPAARAYGAVDLLVSPTELQMARQVLLELGFERRAAATDDATGDAARPVEPFVRTGDGATVGVHRTLHGCEHVDDALVWDAFSSGAERLVVEEVEMAMPRLAARVLHVTLRPDPTQHRLGSTPFVDLERAIARVDLGAWRQAVALARRLGVDDAMGHGLGLMRAGRPLAQLLDLPTAFPVRLLLGGAPSSTQVLAELASLPGWRAKARFAARTLFPPPSSMVRTTPRARPGGAALAWAYATRLCSALRALPEAVLGWRRVGDVTSPKDGEIPR